MTDLAHLYFDTNVIKLAEKYSIMAIEHNEFSTINILEDIYDTQLKLYSVLNKIQNKSPKLEELISKLVSNSSEIRKYNNRKNLLSKIDECPICLEESTVIPRDCAHFYCENCYFHLLDACAICRD